MTKDLALLVGADQRWLSTTGFLDKVADNLAKAMARRKPPSIAHPSLPATNAKRCARERSDERSISRLGHYGLRRRLSIGHTMVLVLRGQ